MATGRDQRDENTASLSLATKVWTSVLAFVLVTWFLFAWLILDRHVLDAAGESVGTAFAIAVIVSLVGAVRSGR
jgi:hypothetical protein